MRNIFQLTQDLRAWADMGRGLADEMDDFAALFSGGPAQAAPFPLQPGSEDASPSPPRNKNKGLRATEEQKLLIRHLWFALPVKEQVLQAKREIARKTGVDTQMVSTIIRRTRKADLDNFLKRPELQSSAARST